MTDGAWELDVYPEAPKVLSFCSIHRIPNGGRLGKASVREHENEAGEDRIENLQKSVR